MSKRIQVQPQQGIIIIPSQTKSPTKSNSAGTIEVVYPSSPRSLRARQRIPVPHDNDDVDIIKGELAAEEGLSDVEEFDDDDVDPPVDPSELEASAEDDVGHYYDDDDYDYEPPVFRGTRRGRTGRGPGRPRGSYSRGRGRGRGRRGRPRAEFDYQDAVEAKVARKMPGIILATAPPSTEDDDVGTGSTMNILSEKKLTLGQRVTLIQGKLIDLPVDAIVNPTTATLNLDTEYCRDLQRVGGREFEVEVQDLLYTHGELELCGAALCPGRNFPARHVIHVNSPQAIVKDANRLLEKAVKNILLLADSMKLRTVAIPHLNVGNMNFDNATAAKVILEGMSSFLASGYSKSLKQVFFVLNEPKIIGTYTMALAKLERPDGDDDF